MPSMNPANDTALVRPLLRLAAAAATNTSTAADAGAHLWSISFHLAWPFAFILTISFLTSLWTLYCYYHDDEDARRSRATQRPEPAGVPSVLLVNCVAREEKGSGGGRQDCCAICLSDLEEGEVVMAVSDCGHAFHAQCILKWLQAAARDSCPVCRRAVVVAGGGRGVGGDEQLVVAVDAAAQVARGM